MDTFLKDFLPLMVACAALIVAGRQLVEQRHAAPPDNLERFMRQQVKDYQHLLREHYESEAKWQAMMQALAAELREMRRE